MILSSMIMILKRSKDHLQKIRQEIGMKNCIFLLDNEYRHNKKFRQYVDKYCAQNKISVNEALSHELVRQVYLYYTDT